MNKTTVHFVRHAEVYNPKQVLYGRLPRFSISKEGRLAVEMLAKQIIKRDISAIYSSPMLRARQTAGIISKYLNIKPSISKYLTEVKLIFEGMPVKKYKNEIQPFIFSSKYVKKGNESIEDILKRVMKLLDRIILKHRNQEIVIVSHGDPIVIFLSYAINKEFTWEFKRDNYLKTAESMTFIYDNDKKAWNYEKQVK
jgi:broad specificity phosphatase PhoE